MTLEQLVQRSRTTCYAVCVTAAATFFTLAYATAKPDVAPPQHRETILRAEQKILWYDYLIGGLGVLAVAAGATAFATTTEEEKRYWREHDA